MSSTARKIAALECMTTANGCTPPEAAIALAKLEALRYRERAAQAKRLSEVLKSDRPLSELRLWRNEVIAKSDQRDKSKIYREFKRQEDLLTAQLMLVAELKRRHRSMKRADACKLVNEAVEKLLSGQH